MQIKFISNREKYRKETLKYFSEIAVLFVVQFWDALGIVFYIRSIINDQTLAVLADLSKA